MTEDEKYVREQWERAEACPSMVKPKCCISLGGRGFTRTTIPDTISGYAETEAIAWSAAAEFTRTRLHQIRDVEEEIGISMYCIADLKSMHTPAAKRILGRLQAALADLKRGLRVAE